MERRIPPRAEIPPEYTWDLKSIFPTDAGWSAALKKLQSEYPRLSGYAGRLNSPEILLEYLSFSNELQERFWQVYVYAQLNHDGDTADQHAAAQIGEVRSLAALIGAASAFEVPEIVALGKEKFGAFMEEVPELQLYLHYCNTLFERAKHVRSSEVEEVLALASDPLGSPEHCYRMLCDTDLQFRQVNDKQGAAVDVAQGTIDILLADEDRSVRKAAWESYSDSFLAFKNTFAAALEGAVKKAVFNARVRRYDSALAAALHHNFIPRPVYDQTLQSCRKNLPLWHRYWDLRRRALGLPVLECFDIFAPLSKNPPEVTYDAAVNYLIEGMAPLGQEYLEPMRRGLLEERWVDVYPCKGKRSNAYSSGTKGTRPFILLNYGDNLSEMSVLAHEMGHSMHTYFTNETQPFVYTGYSIFVAEVASNFNQALVRAHLLQANSDRDFQLAVLDEAFANFHRYLFVMPMLAQFELETHTLVERGEALTADTLCAVMLKLLKEGYGPAMHIDEPRAAMFWSQFGHLYYNFYVYQYATGIAAANALAQGVLDEKPEAARSYLSFLKIGSAQYPIDALKIAGIDMTRPEPMEQAFSVLKGFIDKLEALL